MDFNASWLSIIIWLLIIVLLAKKQRWFLSLAFVCLIIYNLLVNILHIKNYWLAMPFAIACLAICAIELVRIIRHRRQLKNRLR